MNAAQFVAAIEDRWKELKPSVALRDDYIRKSSKYLTSDLPRIFDELLDKCVYPPKLADIYTAAETLLIKPKENKVKRGCDKCRWTGWIRVECEDPNGHRIIAVKRCPCVPEPKKTEDVPF